MAEDKLIVSISQHSSSDTAAYLNTFAFKVSPFCLSMHTCFFFKIISITNEKQTFFFMITQDQMADQVHLFSLEVPTALTKHLFFSIQAMVGHLLPNWSSFCRVATEVFTT